MLPPPAAASTASAEPVTSTFEATDLVLDPTPVQVMIQPVVPGTVCSAGWVELAQDADGDCWTTLDAYRSVQASQTVDGFIPAESSLGVDCDDTRADLQELRRADADGDGFYGVARCVAADGDDAGMSVAWEAGQPTDCDDADAGVQRWRYVDTDGDSFQDDDQTRCVAAGEGLDPTEARGLDCDATDPGRQVWLGVDADGDGYFAQAGAACVGAAEVEAQAPSETPPTAPDCDDGNAATNPGAVEAWFDGVDSNCDGRDDPRCAGVVTPPSEPLPVYAECEALPDLALVLLGCRRDSAAGFATTFVQLLNYGGADWSGPLTLRWETPVSGSQPLDVQLPAGEAGVPFEVAVPINVVDVWIEPGGVPECRVENNFSSEVIRLP